MDASDGADDLVELSRISPSYMMALTDVGATQARRDGITFM
jgi:hypothetical protein